MKHTIILRSINRGNSVKNALARATGKFYTPSIVANNLANDVVSNIRSIDKQEITVVDPFCGDGRLIVALLREASLKSIYKGIHWRISFWDYDADAVALAQYSISKIANELCLDVSLDPRCHDSFLLLQENYGKYDCVITNPPWESIKPDSRELLELDEQDRKAYLTYLKEYDSKLISALPLSQPLKRFAGWGTNLSRCGTELAIKLMSDEGICGLVIPLSLLMDQSSIPLRRWMFTNTEPICISSYPAEAKLIPYVDQNMVTVTLLKHYEESLSLVVNNYNRNMDLVSESKFTLSQDELEDIDWCLPVSSSLIYLKLIRKWMHLRTAGDLESTGQGALWLGRELDETRYREFTSNAGQYQFIKGRMVHRFCPLEPSPFFINLQLRHVPKSALHYRIAWRDVSRRSQSRRMQATIIPPYVVTGNSLHVGFFKDDDYDRLLALLAVVNSLPFEFQIRSRLGTGHMSIGVMRRVKIPPLDNPRTLKKLSKLVTSLLSVSENAIEDEINLEVEVARLYGLEAKEYIELLDQFENITKDFKSRLFTIYNNDQMKNETLIDDILVEKPGTENSYEAKIPNHYSAKLSELDLQIAVAVPPGGNWKNIPETIPSKRLEQIRKNYCKGKGSRSTYYGRLRPESPSYTINTNFNRPGNGCHLHYDYMGKQHRVISQREAARLQSFPDNFIFSGSKRSINSQIGNAVPPLLAYQIAKVLPFRGNFVDLFCGAGGLSLGFKWAGWKPILATDIEPSFLETYSKNIHKTVIEGDIRDKNVFNKIVNLVSEIQKQLPGEPLIMLGGPPCQGFSTAGNKRSIEDKRNLLFQEYKAMLEVLHPDAFIFENVTGITNMEGGKIFDAVKSELHKSAKTFYTWMLQTVNYGIPQRRTRVILIGLSREVDVSPPPPITYFGYQPRLFSNVSNAVSVFEALSDLPPLQSGEDGSSKNYISEPNNPYQLLMRSKISAADYTAMLTSQLH